MLAVVMFEVVKVRVRVALLVSPSIASIAL
jgi:hypothetical protein